MHKYQLDVYFEKSPWLDPINTWTRRKYLFHFTSKWDMDKFNKFMQKCRPTNKQEITLKDIVDKIKKVEAGYGSN